MTRLPMIERAAADVGGFRFKAFAPAPGGFSMNDCMRLCEAGQMVDEFRSPRVSTPKSGIVRPWKKDLQRNVFPSGRCNTS